MNLILLVKLTINNPFKVFANDGSAQLNALEQVFLNNYFGPKLKYTFCHPIKKKLNDKTKS